MRSPPPTAGFEAIAKETWLLDAARRASDVLAAAGVASVLLKGCALAGWLHRPGARPMTDCDLLVARRDRDRATRALQEAGYRRVPRPHSPTGMRWHPTLDFAAPSGALVDVHVGVGAWPRFRVDDAGILARSSPAQGVGGTARRPCIADLIWLHALDLGKDDGVRKPTADADLDVLAEHATAQDWSDAATRARAAGCAGTLWLRVAQWDRSQLSGRGGPHAALLASTRPHALRRWALHAVGERPGGRAARLAAGLAHTDSPSRYAAAVAFYAGRTLIDAALLRTSR